MAAGLQSEAARELGNSEVRADGSPWGDAPVPTAYALAAVLLMTATDCLRALGDPVKTMTTTYTSGVLSRAVVESAAQAWWLLEGGIGARRRMIRSVLIRASSARWLKKAVQAADPADGASNYGEDQARVNRYAAALDLSYVCNRVRRLPGYTSRAPDFEKAVGVSAAYDIYSGAAHAELYAVMQGWREAGPPYPPARCSSAGPTGRPCGPPSSSPRGSS